MNSSSFYQMCIRDRGSDYKDYLNPDSVTVRTGCKLEQALADAKPGEKFQFCLLYTSRCV